jgi:hypothetical protein
MQQFELQVFHIISENPGVWTKDKSEEKNNISLILSSQNVY